MASQTAAAAYQKEYETQRRIFHLRWFDELLSQTNADPWNYDYKAAIKKRKDKFPADEKIINELTKGLR